MAKTSHIQSQQGSLYASSVDEPLPSIPSSTQATQQHAPHISWTLQEPRWDLGMKAHILGDGVAAMMLASRANELPEHDISIVHPHGAPMSRDHMLGFWNMDGLESAVECSRASWPKWAVITDTAKSIMHSQARLSHYAQGELSAKLPRNCRTKWCLIHRREPYQQRRRVTNLRFTTASSQ